MVSLSFRERLSGSYWLLEDPTDERAIALDFEARTCEASDFFRTGIWTLTGIIDAEGLARRSEVTGTLRVALIEERRMPYRFVFRGDDGCRYELRGQKEWTSLAPVSSMTLLPATLIDKQGDELARATLRFDLRADWAEWMKSFRLRLRG